MGAKGRLGRWTRAVVRVLVGATAIVIGLFFFLVRTGPGQEILVEQIRSRVLVGLVDGTISLEEVRSRDLRWGVTLVGLRIDDPDGTTVVRADSVTARYRWRDFLGGDVVLSELTLFGSTVTATRPSVGEPFGVVTVFAPDESEGASGPTARVAIRDLRVVGGTVDVRMPVEPPVPARVWTEPAPDGDGLVRRMAFEEIDAEIPRALLAGAFLEGPELTVESLSLVARVYEEPGRVDNVVGIATLIDGRIRLEARELILGGSRAWGDAVVDLRGEEGLVTTLNFTTEDFDPADLQWIEPRLPAGSVSGGVHLAFGPDGMDWDFEAVEAVLGSDRIRADGGFSIGDREVSTADLDLLLAPLAFDRIRPWTEVELPPAGRMSGDLSLDGPLRRLSLDGRLTFEELDSVVGPITADLSGVVHVGDEPGFTDFTATVDSLDYAVLSHFVPESRIGGSGRVSVRATGALSTGLRFDLDVLHEDPGSPASRIFARGSVRAVDERYVVDVTADAAPFSFTTLRRYYPRIPLSSEVRGAVRARGTLSDLEITTDLESPAGRIALAGRFDVRDPGRHYNVSGDVSRFELSALVPELPQPTTVSGAFSLEGQGLELSTARATGRVHVRRARLGHLDVDTAAVSVRLDGGYLQVDTLDALFGGVQLNGDGSLALEEESPAGALSMAFQTDSIGRLRPLIRGDTVIARDTIAGANWDFLVAEGIDPDTLPTRAEVAMGGAVSGRVDLSGSLSSFDASGEIDFDRIVYGTSSARSGQLRFSAAGLPALAGEMHFEANADSLDILDRTFSSGAVEIDYLDRDGRFDLRVVRHDDEDYRARAAFRVDSAGGEVRLEEMALRFDTLTWELADTAVVSWEGSGVTFEDLEIVRAGPAPMRMRASGTLPRQGDADFVLDLEGVQLARITQILQREDLALTGLVDVHLEVRGRAAAPTIEGVLAASDLRYESFDLSRLEGVVSYRDRAIDFDLDAWRSDLRILDAQGTVPADLSLVEVEDRFPDTEMDIRVSADSLPATFVFALLDDLEEIRGTVDGDFTIAGTVAEPEPSGRLRLNDAGFYLPALGVEYQAITGTLDLRDDATVEVAASGRAEGTIEVSGEVLLEPLSNPVFDLVITLDQFRAVDRRDIEGVVSGSVTLTDAFRSPDIDGIRSEGGRGLRVDRGTIYLEEFQRNARVVDLSDPRIFDFADENLLRVRPVIERSQNPFLEGLRVNVELNVERDTWLRSPDMNVEMRGLLDVTYDRSAREIVLVGDLEALRGDYTKFSSRFQVQEGQIEFVGTPGVNPNLDITAQTRVRRPEAEALVVVANVTGTLLQPRVTLSSPDQAIAQSDLVSYLLFGQPSYALTAGQAASVRNTAGAVLGSAGGALGAAALGTLTNRLGSIVAQNVGLDYFAISQPSNLFGGESLSSSFAQTTIEGGVYVSDDLFLIAVLRPLGSLGTSGSVLGGLRMEWTASEAYTVELFLEDRFLRSRAFGFQDAGLRSSLVIGLFLFREWGY